MSKAKVESFRRKSSGIRGCVLCGMPFPVQILDDARTCTQWSNYLLRNLSDPGDVSTILALSVLDRICLLMTSVNRGLHAIDHIEDVSMDLSDTDNTR